MRLAIAQLSTCLVPCASCLLCSVSCHLPTSHRLYPTSQDPISISICQAMEKRFCNRMINYSKCKTLRMSDLKQIQILYMDICMYICMYYHRKMRTHVYVYVCSGMLRGTPTAFEGYSPALALHIYWLSTHHAPNGRCVLFPLAYFLLAYLASNQNSPKEIAEGR